jgi:hypothetical protein
MEGITQRFHLSPFDLQSIKLVQSGISKRSVLKDTPARWMRVSMQQILLIFVMNSFGKI